MTSLVLYAVLTFAVRAWLVLVICDPLSLLFPCFLLAERVSDILLCDDWAAPGYWPSLDHCRTASPSPDNSFTSYAVVFVDCAAVILRYQSRNLDIACAYSDPGILGLRLAGMPVLALC